MAGLLRRLTSGGVALYFMHGNRDFLLAERFCEATGARLLADPTVHEIQGVRTLLVHGDTLCTDDVDYQSWRRTARSGGVAARIPRQASPIDAATSCGCAKAKEIVQAKPAEIMDVNEAAVAQAHGEPRRHPHGPRPPPAQASCANIEAAPPSAGCFPTGTSAAATWKSGRGALARCASSNSYPGR